MSKRAFYAVLVLMMLAFFVIFAPGFLFTEDVTRKADAVVLFVGPGNEARRYESEQLIREGYARYLLIPSSGKVFKKDADGGLVRIVGNQPRADFVQRVRIAANYKKYYENTHIEALEAKRMMNELGLKSAMLVSSAYHMRRIRIIAGLVFDSRTYTITCNPAKWQTEFTAVDWLDGEKRRIIGSEYLKIGWFLVYGVFG
jgi:uncharacterized SAM-binding protein YcdF (DUF218 family)